MGELFRQPSKVWWGSFPGADVSEDGNRPWAAALNASTPRVADEPTSPPAEAQWDSQREESSSPSGGSHGSQDSGFSDSELHHVSPQDSPDLSKRLQEETPKRVQGDAELASTPATRPKTSPLKKFTYQVVEFQEDCCNAGYLETDFSENASATIISPRRPMHCDDQEKLNKIQNQLELKVPNRITTPPTARVSPVSRSVASPEPENDGYTSESVRSSCSEHTVIEIPIKNTDTVANLDRDGFKIPKSVDFRGSCTSLNFASNPPLSCSTPKGTKSGDSSDSAQSSPHLVRPARAQEKAKSFATVRKLKALSKPRRSERVLKILARSGCLEKQPPDSTHPVAKWLDDLETQYEAEIMTTLQSKSLASDLARQVTNMAATTSDTVRKLHLRTKAISVELTKLCQYMKCKKYRQASPLAQSLISHIREFMREFVLPEEDVNCSSNSNDKSKCDKASFEKCYQEITQKEETKCTNCQKPKTKIFKRHESSKLTKCHCKNSNSAKENSDAKMCCPLCHKMLTNGVCKCQASDDRQVHGKGSNERVPLKAVADEVLNACSRLGELSTDIPNDCVAFNEQRMILAKQFRVIVDKLLLTHVKALVSVLEEPQSEMALRTALEAICTLGLEGNQLSELVGESEGVRALLAVILEARAPAIRIGALRALATVCCVPSTVIQFQQAGGVEIVSDVLCDQRRSEEEVREAAAVLAQITAPWLPDNPPLPHLAQYLPSLVSSLTRLLELYKTSETLLLCSAAVANLTFLEPRTVWYLLENNTAVALLDAVKRQGPKVSVFIQEQAATVLANMAAIPEVRAHLAQQRAVVALLCFLQIRHSPLQRPPQVSAAERVLQKTAIALSRLCGDATVARQVVELEGVKRLVRLCKDDAERNHSDGVLVACLAALRKIVANCGAEVIEDMDALELIEPKLLDSFLLYSSKQESYV